MGSSDKRFAPSARKLRKARENGDVAKSKDLSASLVMISGLLVVFLMVLPSAIIWHLFCKSFVIEADFSNEMMIVSLKEALLSTFQLLWPFFAVVFLVALSIELSQVGFRISWKLLAPNFERLSFSKNLKNILGIEEQDGSQLPMGKLCGMACRLVICIVLYVAIGALILRWCSMWWFGLDFFNPTDLSVALILILKVVLTLFCVICAAVAGWDYLRAVQKRRARLSMDINELREESRDTEGNPELRQARNRLRHEASAHSVTQGVRRAKVVVVSER